MEGFQHALQTTIGNHEICLGAGQVGRPGNSKRGVGQGEHRCIVEPVAHHAHACTGFLQDTYTRHFFLWRQSVGMQRHAERRSESWSAWRTVAGEQFHLQAQRVPCGSNHVLRLFAHRVIQADPGQRLVVVGNCYPQAVIVRWSRQFGRDAAAECVAAHAVVRAVELPLKSRANLIAHAVEGLISRPVRRKRAGYGVACVQLQSRPQGQDLGFGTGGQR